MMNLYRSIFHSLFHVAAAMSLTVWWGNATAQVQVGTALNAGARIDSIEVFHSAAQPVNNPGQVQVTDYVIDQLKGFTDRLSQGLPNTPAAASRVAQARLQALSDQDKAWIRRAATANVRAAQYHLTKTPAIVINGHAVLYGVSDVAQAISLYQRWRAGVRP